MQDDGINHGTSWGYAKCRELYGKACRFCLDGMREANKKSLERSRKKFATQPELFKDRHGTRYLYKLGCRCKWCSKTNSDIKKKSELRRTKVIPERVHGTNNGYKHYGCRCKPCKKAAQIYKAELKKRTILTSSESKNPA